MEKLLEIVLTVLLILAIGIPLLVLLVYITGAAFQLLYQSLKNLFPDTGNICDENYEPWLKTYRDRNEL